jgi:hypothetical protein
MLLRNCVSAARGLVVLGPFACALFCGTPASAEIKSFRDWIAACDNTRTCNAYGFDADIGGNAYLQLARDGAPDAPLRITLAVNMDGGSKFELAFDDPALAGLPARVIDGKTNGEDDLKRLDISNPNAVEPMIAGMRKAKKLIVTRIDEPGGTPNDPAATEISLSGMVAALLWIDEQQKRVGTVTALIGRGDKPAAAVPPPPAAPVVPAIKISPMPDVRKAPAAVIAKARAVCRDRKVGDVDDATRLGADEVMYWFQCNELSGAYNYFYALLIAAPGKPVREVEFRLPRELAGQGQDHGDVEMNMNPGFDESIQTLSMLNKGRGISDCGLTSDWVWDGHAFRLIASRSMPTCKGVAPSDWPTLYRAERK